MEKISTVLLATVSVLASPASFSQDYDIDRKRINVSSVVDTTVTAEALDITVNSPYIESGPMITKDGKTLYFSRARHPENIGGVKDIDIWYSVFDDVTQNWNKASNLGAPLNNRGPNFLCGVGWKGDTVLLANVYGKNGKMSPGVSIATKSGNTWSFPVSAFVNNDYNLSDRVGYDLSHDRHALIIAEQKVDSYGKMDLYVSFREMKGKREYAATESVNLGNNINSSGNETSPFLSYDGMTLFFSSDGHKGYGGEDIFMARRLDDTWQNWSKPENLGSGINTKYHDSYFGFTPTSRYAYYSRGLTPDNADIYQVDLSYLFNDLADRIKNPGNYAASKEKTSLSIGQTHIVNHVFDDDNSDIRKESMEELQAIFNYLNRYNTMTVHIGTHSNEHESRNESFTLSSQRIDTIRKYLTGKGIESSRLYFEGFGHDVVVNTNGFAMRGVVASSVEFKFVNYGR